MINQNISSYRSKKSAAMQIIIEGTRLDCIQFQYHITISHTFPACPAARHPPAGSTADNSPGARL
jgi:hypothetical protein